ncbi:MAG: glutaredoxin domain-containing protein [Promethearchaeota archaeon]
MNLPIIITKKDCHRCKELKEWLKNNNRRYVEKDIDDVEFVQQLLNDKNFILTFCDEEGCIVNTPIVIYKGRYWFKELWGVSGLREKEAKKIFDLE